MTDQSYVLDNNYLQEKCNILNKKLEDLDEIDKRFSNNALRVLASRYLIRDENGNIIESPKECFERIAITISLVDLMYDPFFYDKKGEAFEDPEVINVTQTHLHDVKKEVDIFIGEYKLNVYHIALLKKLWYNLKDSEECDGYWLEFNEVLEVIRSGKFNKYAKNIKQYFDLMANQIFFPNTPTLINAGRKLNQLSACFVLGMKDDIDSIMDTAKDVAKIFKSGGGVGINYSDLRPNGYLVNSTSGKASGPISFMKIIDSVTDVVKQAGVRRGANMGIMNVSHPDVMDFIRIKTVPNVLENFNISVGFWNDFWTAYKTSTLFPLKFNNVFHSYINPEKIIDTIALSAWESAEPGVIFFDNINRYNPLLNELGMIKSTNPCAEIPLYENESCNLGSINVTKFINEFGEFDHQKYIDTIHICTKFLDNVIDATDDPLPKITERIKSTRRIGLGLMGCANLLYILNIPYNSKKGCEYIASLCETLTTESMEASINLSIERGSFPLFNKSNYINEKLPIKTDNNKHIDIILKIKQYGIRNCWTTTFAPTGSLSMLADTSNGIEPNFSITFKKKVAVGDFYYSNKYVEDALKKYGLYTEEILEKIVKNAGSLKDIDEIPEALQKIFVTAIDIHWLDHIVMQSVCQRWISNAISKTINMSKSATIKDIKNAYLISHELGCKGLSVYRDGSREKQVLHTEEKTDGFITYPPSNYAMQILSEHELDFKLEDLYNIEKPKHNPLLINITSYTQCPSCKDLGVKNTDGCLICVYCAWTACSN